MFDRDYEASLITERMYTKHLTLLWLYRHDSTGHRVKARKMIRDLRDVRMIIATEPYR